MWISLANRCLWDAPLASPQTLGVIPFSGRLSLVDRIGITGMKKMNIYWHDWVRPYFVFVYYHPPYMGDAIVPLQDGF